MVHHDDVPFKPDYAIAPGETVKETLETLEMTQADLAGRTGLTAKTINLIIKGAAPITATTAMQFEAVLGPPASFWMNLERQFQEDLARRREADSLEGDLGWLDTIPVRAIEDRGYIPKGLQSIELLRAALRFFGVASVQQWKLLWKESPASYRASPAFEKDPGAVAVWLRLGELEARNRKTAPWDPAKFRSMLDEARSLTNQNPTVFKPALEGRCAAAGVAVAFVPELPKIRMSGATRWLTPTKALLQLNLRYKTNDQLWFTFFHEAGHLLLHGKRDKFLEEKDPQETTNSYEREADQFAADKLIPPALYRRFITGRVAFNKKDIVAFASECGIHPVIVVGRLQHDKLIPFRQHNDLKQSLHWGEEPPATGRRSRT